MRFPIIIVYMEGDLFSTSRWLPCTCTFESWPCRFDLVVSLWVALLLFCPQFVPTHHLSVPGRSCVQILSSLCHIYSPLRDQCDRCWGRGDQLVGGCHCYPFTRILSTFTSSLPALLPIGTYSPFEIYCLSTWLSPSILIGIRGIKDLKKQSQM